MNVVILGASDKPDRYSYRAQVMLAEAGHRVFPVRPAGGEILGVEVYSGLAEIDEPIDTVTVYVNPQRLEPVVAEIIQLAPRRVILNPGTESENAAEQIREAGIEVEEGCTLVLLNGDMF